MTTVQEFITNTDHYKRGVAMATKYPFPMTGNKGYIPHTVGMCCFYLSHVNMDLIEAWWKTCSRTRTPVYNFTDTHGVFLAFYGGGGETRIGKAVKRRQGECAFNSLQRCQDCLQERVLVPYPYKHSVAFHVEAPNCNLDVSCSLHQQPAWRTHELLWEIDAVHLHGMVQAVYGDR